MRIGIDATFRMYGGSVTHLQALLRVWRERTDHEFLVFSGAQNRDVLADLVGGAVRVVPIHAPASRAKRLVWFHCVFPSILRRFSPDVVLFAGGYMPLFGSPPCVVIFRNAAPFCSGMTRSTLGYRAYASFRLLGLLMRHSAHRAECVVFPSRYLQQVFATRFGIVQDRHAVIYHGRESHLVSELDMDAFRDTYHVDRPFALYVSHLYRYKNVAALIRAYHRARDAMRRHNLALVVVGGSPDPAYSLQLEALIRDLGLEHDVRLFGALLPDDVARAMAACEFFVFPSQCENCPNSLIQALSAGKPVATSNLSVMPEICGDAAAYFDPQDVASIAAQLTMLAENTRLRAELAARSILRSAQFPTWPEVAEATLRRLERTAVRVESD